MTPKTVAHQAPLVHGISRQEYWNGLPFPSLGDGDPGTGPATPALAGRFFTTGEPTPKHPPNKTRAREHQKTCAGIFRAASFVIAGNWRQ